MAVITFGNVAGLSSDDTKWVGGAKPLSTDTANWNASSAQCTIDNSPTWVNITTTATTAGFVMNTPITITGSVDLTGLIISGSSKTIIFSGTAAARTFNGAGNTLSQITFSFTGIGMTISGNNTFTNTTFSGNSKTVKFTSGSTTTFTNPPTFIGSNGQPHTISGATPGSVANWTMTTGKIFTGDFLILQDIACAVTGALWYAGHNSRNVSGNTGWIFYSGITSAYNMREGSGITLLDRSGLVNGTLGGASLPIWQPEGFLKFSGGHGAVAGNYNRVDFGLPVSMQKAWNDSFSIALGFKSSEANGQVNQLFGIMDFNTVSQYININIQANNTFFYQLIAGTSTQKYGNPAGSVCDGNWKLSILTFTNNIFACYLNGILLTNTLNNTFTTGNMYIATSKATIGARYTSATSNYINDATADICLLKIWNIALSAAQVQNETNDFFMLY